MGAISDTYGRKKVMVLSTFTLLCASFVVLLTAKWELPWAWSLIANAISGATGNFVVILMVIFASVSDGSLEGGSRRMINVAKAEGCIFIGAGLGFYTYGQVKQHWLLFVITTAAYGAAFLWAIFGITETLPRAKRRPWPGLKVANLFGSVGIFTRNKNLAILAIVFSLQCCVYFG
jgi:MFS family permease